MSQKPTQAEIEAEVRLAAVEGRVPFDGRRAGAPSVPQPETREGVFTAADLTGALLADCLEFTVPRTGKRLYVFGVAPADHKLMLRWSVSSAGIREDEDETEQRLKLHELQQELKLCQVILACRQGPSRDAPRCFSVADRPALRKYMGQAVVDEICRLSDQLSGNDEQLGLGVRRFFGSIQRCLQISSSALSTWEGCPPGLRESLTRCESLVSRALLRGALDQEMLGSLEEL